MMMMLFTDRCTCFLNGGYPDSESFRQRTAFSTSLFRYTSHSAAVSMQLMVRSDSTLVSHATQFVCRHSSDGQWQRAASVFTA